MTQENYFNNFGQNKKNIPDKSPQTIQKLFNSIASNYDLANNLMSLYTHNYVKYKCIKTLNIKPHENVLDVCCGTGDLIKFILQLQPFAHVSGLDFSENMIKEAKQKNKNNSIRFIKGDATSLPFKDNSFDFITMSFGLRNISNAEKAVEEIYRVLKKGGKFLHLDFGKRNFLSKVYEITTPILTSIIGDSKAYNYLIQSKRIFPPPQDLIKDFESKGFKLYKKEDYLFEVISAQIMTK